MADIKYAEGKYDEARVLFEDYTNRFPMLSDAAAVQKQLGDTYRLMKRYDEAIAAYNKLLSVKEWRGSLWPEALYWIGICEMERDNARPAFAYFQRVYVLYESHAEWVAKAYLQSAECLVKLGQTADAIKTYREMLGKEVLAGRPELETAKQALARLEGKS
jgi:TolA-binding protein